MIQTITSEELHQRLANGDSLNLVDVREPHEHADFNIGGILLPLGSIQSMQIDAIEDLKEEEIICYCRSGNRSGQATMILNQIGFNNVINLTGGMLEWEAKYGR